MIVALVAGTALALASLTPAAPPAAEERPPALRLDAGAIAEAQMVGVGRDVYVDGEAKAGVTALDGSAYVSGIVNGELTVLGGNATLLPGARIRGAVHVLGGRLEVAPGATIEGRSVAYPTISKAWTTLLEGPSLGLPASSPVVIAAKLGLVAAWLAVLLVLFAAFPRELVAASDEIRREPLLCFFSGLVAVLGALLALLLLIEILPAPASLPLVVVVLLAAIAARLWGVIALFHAFGRALALTLGYRRLQPLQFATVGLLLLAVAKMLPYVGVVVWGAATFVGVGAALRTRFGRLDAPSAVDLALVRS